VNFEDALQAVFLPGARVQVGSLRGNSLSVRRLNQQEAWAVGCVNSIVCGIALIVCGLLSNWVGEWLLWAWFIGAITFNAWTFHGNSVLTYVYICLAFATVAYFNFWHPINPS
jgi:hypothetical protein